MAYGMGTVVCVCEYDPVKKLDLKSILQYCWFAIATMEVKKMDNNLKSEYVVVLAVVVVHDHHV